MFPKTEETTSQHYYNAEVVSLSNVRERMAQHNMALGTYFKENHLLNTVRGMIFCK